MEVCRFVIIIPEDTAGTRWEIDRVIENDNYLTKTIFLNIASANYRGIKIDYTDEIFIETMGRLVADKPHVFPPSDQVVCGFIIEKQLHLICAKKPIDPGTWGSSAKLAIYMKELGLKR